MSAISFLDAMLLAGTVVLAVGWTAAYFLRRRAAWENALWRTVLLVLLILPLAQWVGSPVAGHLWPAGSQHERIAPTVVMTGTEIAGSSMQASPAAPAKEDNTWAAARRGLLWLWGAGTAVSLVGLARSAWKVRRWVRAASPVAAGEERELMADSASTAGVRLPDLRVASALPSPVLVGWRRPCILVPSPEVARQREVLLHELAHLRRADLWWMTLGRIVKAGWWFHPLTWGVGRRMERSAEDVCDDLVVVWTRDAAAYAGQLLRFARQASAVGRMPLAGAAITGFRSELGRRVERVLEPGRTLRVAVGRGGVVSLTMGAALLLTLLAVASPSQGQSKAPTLQPKESAQATPAAAAGEPANGPVAVSPQPTPKSPVAMNDQAALAAMNRKLTGIILPFLEFRRTTVTDGVEFLRQEAQRLDTDTDVDKRGVNIVFAPSLKENDLKKRMTLSLENIPLIEAMRQVARQADMQVVVEPYVVTLKAKDQ